MAQQTLTHAGTITGYVSNGPEARADAGAPGGGGGPGGDDGRRSPFAEPAAPEYTSGQPLLGQDERDQLREAIHEHIKAIAQPHVQVPGPAYGGAAWNDGGLLARAISGPGRTAIEGPKVIRGAIEAAAEI